MIYKLLGQRIRLERFKNNWTQEKLAEMVDISSAYMGQIERGERSVPLDTLLKIAVALNVSFDYLLMDSLPHNEEASKDELFRLIFTRSKEEQKIALDMIKLLYSYLDKNKNNG